MLDFDTELQIYWHFFTNVDWIKERLKDSPLKYVDKYEDCECCIVDKKYIFEKNAAHSQIRISIDGLSDVVDCFISREHILDYLDLLQKSESEDYFVTMADMSDIWGVSKGTLIDYVKINLKSGNASEGIDEIRDVLKGSDSNYGILLLVTVGPYDRVEAYANVLQELYPNAGIIIKIPTASVLKKDFDRKEKYAQVFVFNNEKE